MKHYTHLDHPLLGVAPGSEPLPWWLRLLQWLVG